MSICLLEGGHLKITINSVEMFKKSLYHGQVRLPSTYLIENFCFNVELMNFLVGCLSGGLLICGTSIEWFEM